MITRSAGSRVRLHLLALALPLGALACDVPPEAADRAKDDAPLSEESTQIETTQSALVNGAPDLWIQDVVVISGSSTVACPTGYTKLNKDLNEGARGKFIYLCWTKDPAKGGGKILFDFGWLASTARDMRGYTGDCTYSGSPCYSYYLNPIRPATGDLNEGSGMHDYYVYLSKRLAPEPCMPAAGCSFSEGYYGSRVSDLAVVSSSSSSVACPTNYSRIDLDLNKGARGKYIYLCQKRLAYGWTPSTSGTCSGASQQWAGCRGTGCHACTEYTRDYPLYFVNHPNCIPNSTCGGTGFASCSDNCPAPTPADKKY